MRQLLDIVNFNADASCLSSERWLEVLNGGPDSALCRWLNLYIEFQKKVILGFTGAALSDIACMNPAAIHLLRTNPEIFEIILRPYAHDIGLLRLWEGFRVNFRYGRVVIGREFNQTSNYFLSPEFMITNEQISLLSTSGVEAIFINPSRFSPEVRHRIPSAPYLVRGLFGTALGCIPITGDLTFDYLDALHNYNCASWNDRILNAGTVPVFSWRDGESSFLLTDGLRREAFWLKHESEVITRVFLRDMDIRYTPPEGISPPMYKSYPVHSFSAWMKEFRMIGYIRRVQALEENIRNFSMQQLAIWLQTINSDILSAVEKRSPRIRIREEPEEERFRDLVIHRSERGFEGEEYLSLLERTLAQEEISDFLRSSEDPHIIKLRKRIYYLTSDINAGHTL